MPVLKNVACSVEWSGSNVPLQEYQTSYADGFVEAYIAVPPFPTPFSVHLQSSGYIAPGLAMFVYMDGVYQCNRNRFNLKIPAEASKRRHTEVDFRVRQKEERTADGLFQGKQWKFEMVNVSDGDPNAIERPPFDGEYVGTIEVIVLRCYTSDMPSAATAKTDGPDEPLLFGAMFDGPSDTPLEFLQTDGPLDTHPSLSSSRRRKKPKPEQIEIHNSNVHIYHAPPETSHKKNSRYPKRPTTQYAMSDYEGSERLSPRAEILSRQGHSTYNRTYTGSDYSRGLQLRGGAPGSYTREEAGDGDWDNTAEVTSVADNNGWNTDWNAADQSSTTQAWGTADDAQQAGNSWSAGQNIGHQNGNTAWEPVVNSLEKRNEWGDLIEEVEEGQDGGDNSPKWPDGNQDNDWATDNTTPGNQGWANEGQSSQGRSNDHQSGGSGNGTDGWGQNDNQNQNTRTDWQSHGSDKGNKNAWTTNQGNAPSNNNNNQGKDGNGWSNQGGNGDHNQPSQPSSSRNTSGSSNGWATSGNSHQQGNIQGTPAPTNAEPNLGSTDISRKEKPQSGGPTASKTSGRAPRPRGKPQSKTTPSAATTKSSSNKDWSSFQSKFLQAKSSSEKPRVVSNESIPANMPGSWSPPMRPSEPTKTPTPTQHALPTPTVPATTPQPSTMAQAPKPKGYWSSWAGIPPTPVTDESIISPDEPIYTLPAHLASQNGLTHQVRPMPAAAYRHKLATPKYMDTHDDPYAVFLFKYRDKAVIERMIGRPISDPIDEKTRLASLSKQEIIEELLKSKGQGVAANAPPSTADASAAAPLVSNVWQQSNADAWNNQAAASAPMMSGAVVADKDESWGKNPKGAGPWAMPAASGKATTGGAGGGGGGQGGGNDAGGNGGGGWGGNDNGAGDSGGGGGGNGGGGEGWGNDNSGGNGNGGGGENEQSNGWGGDDQQNGNDGGGQGSGDWGNDNGGGGGGWETGGKSEGDGGTTSW